jgi:Transcription factor WhiB
MDLDAFINATDPAALYAALDPTPPPAGPAACVTHDPRRFASPARQQAAFDGDPVDAATDYAAARRMCLACPLLAACRRYAAETTDTSSFLAGNTPEQRHAGRGKADEVALRRRQVKRLTALGAPTSVIAGLLGRDPSLIRGDLRALGRQDRAM